MSSPQSFQKKKRAKPSQHIRKVLTKKGKKRVLINKGIQKKKVKKEMPRTKEEAEKQRKKLLKKFGGQIKETNPYNHEEIKDVIDLDLDSLNAINESQEKLDRHKDDTRWALQSTNNMMKIFGPGIESNLLETHDLKNLEKANNLYEILDDKIKEARHKTLEKGMKCGKK